MVALATGSKLKLTDNYCSFVSFQSLIIISTAEVLQEKRYGISVATIRKQKKETEKLPNSLKNMRNKTGANAGSTLPKEIEEAHKRRKENRYLDL